MVVVAGNGLSSRQAKGRRTKVARVSHGIFLTVPSDYLAKRTFFSIFQQRREQSRLIAAFITLLHHCQ